MILSEAKSTAVTSQNFKSHEFGIGDPAFILQLLRKDLYANPVRTVVQEYLANAKDAHVEAGVTTPIHIQAPTTLKPELVIEDFGNSMDEETIMTVFTQYGVSTKRDTDKAIGGFGIGSKSAWCYTDTFNVVARTHENGRLIQRTWSAFIDESGMGKINLMHTKVLPEGTNGTKIVIGVDQYDVGRFQREITSVYRHFDMDLKVTGLSQSEMIKEDIEQLKRSVFFYTDERYVVVSGIRYNWDRNMEVNFPQYAKQIEGLRKNKLAPILQVGDVEIQPDRANIKTSEQNAEALANWYDNYVIEVKETMDEEITKLTEEKDVRGYLHYYHHERSWIKRKILEDNFLASFPQYDEEQAKLLRTIDKHVNFHEGSELLFTDVPHYIGHNLQTRTFDHPCVVMSRKVVRGGYWSGDEGTVSIADLRTLFDFCIVPTPKRVINRDGASSRFSAKVVRDRAWGRRSFDEAADEQINSAKYYITAENKHGTRFYNFGDDRNGEPMIFPVGKLRSLAQRVDGTILLLNKTNAKKAEDMGFVRPSEEINEKIQDVLDHQYNPKTQRYERKVGDNYDMEKVTNAIPECPEKDELRRLQKLENHNSLDMFFNLGLLNRSEFTEVDCNEAIDAGKMKFPLLFDTHYRDSDALTAERTKHVEKYLDLVSKGLY